MKKLIAIISIFSLMIVLVGCGGSSGGESTTNDNSATNSATTETSGDTHSDDEFIIEEVTYDLVSEGEEDECTNIYFKVRNNTGERVDLAIFEIQALDSNGDILGNSTRGDIENLDDGQAMISYENQFYEIPHDKIATVKYIGYSVSKRKEGESNVYESYFAHTLDTPVEYKMNEIPRK